MNKVLLFVEKYTATLFALFGFIVSFFLVNCDDKVISAWLGGSSVPCIFSTVIISFFITLKGTILTIDHNKYAGLKLLQDNPDEKKRFYRHFDSCIYSALFIIITNILYLLIATLNLNILNKLFVVIIISSTFYILSATTILLIILHKIQRYSLEH